MNFNFESTDTTIKNLFKKYTQFRIPVFQRDYSWSPSYYNQFLDDIITSLESRSGSTGSSDSPKNYFVGTMVLSGHKGATTIDVVDGQQRLTVITILFSAISKRLDEIGEKKLSEATFRYVQEEDDNGELINHLQSDSSSPFFDVFVQSLDDKYKEEEQASTLEEESLKKTYTDFYNALSPDDLKKHSVFNNKNYKNALILIRDQLLSATLIEITTTNKSSAYKIFEILNAKGKGLASIDLIKNSIFEKYYNDKGGLEKLASKKWEKIQTNLRERNQNIGLLTFYRQYWLSKYERVTNVQLYDSFKRNFIDSDQADSLKDQYMKFLSDLVEESEEYIKIVHPLLDDYDNRQEYKPVVESLASLYNVLGIKQYIVLVLALMYLKKADLISLQKLKECLRFLESFVFMYTDMGKGQANIYEARFSHLAIKLRRSKNKQETNKIINDDLYDNLKSKRVDGLLFTDNFTRLTYSKKKDKGDADNSLAKYVVKKISSAYQGKESFQEENSIEHIINENPSDLQTLNIGNLIALETKLNGDAGDSSYTQKKDIYSKSKNKQVRKFIDENVSFTKDDISKRAKNLATYYYENIMKKDLKYLD
jgi:uncharacterized protein with ParB-like and HNH nuclease domain